MREPFLTTEIVIGKETNVISSEPIHGQMTFKDNLVTTPVTLTDLLEGQGTSQLRTEVASISASQQSQIDALQSELDTFSVANISVPSYVTTVNNISGAITVVPGSGIEVATLPNGQITVSLYSAISITSFTGGSSNEIGASVASATLNWTLSKNETSQSLNQGIGSLALLLRTYLYSTAMTSNTTFTLSVSDGTTPTNASTTTAFYNRRWWGTSANASFASADILTLANNEFSSTRVKSFTTDGNAQYIYYAYPASFGVATFTVNGLLNTAWTLSVISHTNASGHTENYNIYRTNTVQGGTGIQIGIT